MLQKFNRFLRCFIVWKIQCGCKECFCNKDEFEHECAMSGFKYHAINTIEQSWKIRMMWQMACFFFPAEIDVDWAILKLHVLDLNPDSQGAIAPIFIAMEFDFHNYMGRNNRISLILGAKLACESISRLRLWQRKS